MQVSRLSTTHGYFDYLLNEKSLLERSVAFRDKVKGECYSSESGLLDCLSLVAIVSWFQENLKALRRTCNDYRVFSHCQGFYLFQYFTSTMECHSYSRAPCFDDPLLLWNRQSQEWVQ